MSRIDVWHLARTNSISANLADLSSLDAVTRQLPEGYYSTFRTYDGCTRVLGLRSHLQRLFDPVATPDVDAITLRRELRALLKRYRPGEARVRAVMTRQGEAYLAIEPLQILPQEVYEKGVHLKTTEIQREHPRLKSTGFIGRSEVERKHIAQQGVFEALLVKNGKLLEGMTSNFFYLREFRAERKEILCTARDDILLGVTRDTVIEIARGRGLEVSYKPLHRDQLMFTMEAFITSSSRGIVPVIQIEDVTIGEGIPGPVTRELMAAYEAYVLENAEPI